MRIQARLFLGTAALVLALMGLQWWLYARQLRSIEDDLTDVAATVSTGVLSAEMAMFGEVVVKDADGIWVEADRMELNHEFTTHDPEATPEGDVRVYMVPAPKPDGATEPEGRRILRRQIEEHDDGLVREKVEWIIEAETVDGETTITDENVVKSLEAVKNAPFQPRRLVVKVEDGGSRHDRFLVVSEDDRHLHRIPIPVSPTVKKIQETMRGGAAVGGMLLVAGLFASAILSSRLTKPLRGLADGAEALGRGDLGHQVPETASGEVGDLQRAFNRMSRELEELESQREMWQQREHLAQLGDLSRGLAHTLRNPLHTLGLAVEELADGDQKRHDLVSTSRAQIRRIDHWLRSFLALGAENSAEIEEVDLGELVKGVALEAVQQGSEVEVEERDELEVRVVPGALRAALSNLMENATEASPDGAPVRVTAWRNEDEAVVRIEDHGPGLPDEVKERLFAPHVTTKVGGSGMGLFLARQLIVGMHGGVLEVADGDSGGTVATIRLPISGAHGVEHDVE
jgi:signal transduction histidine kinase